MNPFWWLLCYLCVTLNFTVIRTRAAGVDNCIFRNIDIFIACGADSFPLLSFLMNSLSKFMHCSHGINLLIDRPDIPKARLWFDENIRGHHLRLYPFDYPANIPVITNSKGSRPGYILQAWVMMWADKYSNSSEVDYVMFMDTDCILGMPLTCASLFDEQGRPYVQSWGMEPHQGQFRGPCQDMLGSACDRSYMAMFPFIMPVVAFEPMREHIRHQINPQASTFDDAFNQWARNHNWGLFSQFVMMGEYLRFHQAHLVHQVHCPYLGKGFDDSADHKACEQYVPPGIHYGWPYQPYLIERKNYLPIFDDVKLHYKTKPSFHEELHITSKYTPLTVQLLQDVINHGQCFQHFMKYGNILNMAGCTEAMTKSVHPSLDLYYGVRPLDWNHILNVYSPKNNQERTALFGGKCANRIASK